MEKLLPLWCERRRTERAMMKLNRVGKFQIYFHNEMNVNFCEMTKTLCSSWVGRMGKNIVKLPCSSSSSSWLVQKWVFCVHKYLFMLILLHFNLHISCSTKIQHVRLRAGLLLAFVSWISIFDLYVWCERAAAANRREKREHLYFTRLCWLPLLNLFH